MSCLVLIFVSAQSQNVLSKWTFEEVSLSASVLDMPFIKQGTVQADMGLLTAGSAFKGYHKNSATFWSTVMGNGSARSIAANAWSVGDYWQFSFSTIHYADLSIAWDQTSSKKGPRNFSVQYSVNGIDYINVQRNNGAYTLSNEVWNSGYNKSASKKSFDLSSDTALNNKAIVYIRLVMGSSDTSIPILETRGSSRIDNFMVMGSYTNPTKHYYSKSKGSLDLPANWGSKLDGTGDSPIDFISDAQVFHICNNIAASIARAWTVQGFNSKVVVGDGIHPCNFMIPVDCAFSGDIDVAKKATLTIRNAKTPSLGNLASGSTVKYAQSAPVFIRNAVYDNLELMGATKVIPGGTITVAGNLIFDGKTYGDLTLDAPSGNPLPEIMLGGNLIYVGTVHHPAEGNLFSVITTSQARQTITTNGNTISLYKLETINKGNIIALSDTIGYSNISLGNEWGGGLILAAGSKLDISQNSTLFFKGMSTVSGNGYLRTSASSNIDIKDTASLSFGTLYFDPLANTINNLTIHHEGKASATVILGNSLRLLGNLSITAGQLVTNGYLTIAATANKTGSILAGQGNYINGNVTVQKYIPAMRAFRFLASPVTTTNAIHANWQLSTHITGSQMGLNGFDATITGNPSMFIYDNHLQDWKAIANTNLINLTVGNGFRLLIRGDRTIDLTTNNPIATNTNLSATGSIAMGDLQFNSISINPLSNIPDDGSGNFGWSFIGNPYACAVDWKYLYEHQLLTHVGSYYYSWDPTISNSGSRGAYTVYDAATNMATGGKSINQYIPSGQAIFVQTKASSPSIIFKEAAKNANVIVNDLALSGIQNAVNIQASLLLAENALNGQAADEIKVRYNDNFKQVYHVSKLMNDVDNLFIKTGINNDIIQGRSLSFITDSIQLQTSLLASLKYLLRINLSSFGEKNFEGFVLDRFTQNKTILEIGKSIDLPFEITADNASKAASRFLIVLQSKRAQAAIATNDYIVPFTVQLSNTTQQLVVHYAAAEAAMTNIRLLNSSGQSVQAITVGKQQQGRVVLPLFSLPPGIYIVEIVMGNNRIIKKIVKP